MSKNVKKAKINVEFNEATTRENLVSGESVNTLFGKIKKFLSDLHDSAFTGNAAKVNNHTVNTDVPSDAVFTDTVEYKDVSGSSITLDAACDAPLINLNIYGKSTQDGTPTPDNPVDIVSVGDSGSINVKSCGKNLFDYRLLSSYTANGVTCTNNNDGTFTFSGSKTDISNPFASLKRYTHAESINILKAGKYTLSSNTPQSSGLYACVNLYYNDAWVYDAVNTTPGHTRTFTVTEDMIAYDDFIFELGFFSYWGKDVITGTYNLQLEAGETATEFEPYKGTAASITSSLPLCGIPVSEGGNYTDSNGHQWVRDELIYNADGTGKIVKRTVKIDSYNGEAIATPFISTTGSMTTGAAIIYQLNTPQEIELTSAEISALKQLQTYNGVTNISNDGIADMYVKYWCDETIPSLINNTTTKGALSETLTLSASNWNSNSQEVSSSVATADNVIIVSPIPDDQDTYSKCGIKCSAQAQGTLTFICDTSPTTDIHVNVVTF